MTVGAGIRAVTRAPGESAAVQPPAARHLPRALDARVLLAASVLLSALSLTVNRSPAFDVWSWLLWGREIAHGDLVTSFGPQFKPLPVFVATAASPFGAAAVPIWIFVAHTAGLLGIGATARLAWRSAGPVAAAIAAVSLLSIHLFTFYLLAYGMSEPMLVALVFWAVDRHCDGRRSTAFVLLFGAALLRPEVWPFLIAYAIVLYRRKQAPPLLLAGLLLLVPAAWFLPEWWGSGNPFRTGDGKALPGGPSTKAHPGLAALTSSFDGLLTWVWVGALIAVAWAGWVRDRLMLGLTGIGAAWLVIVAALAEAGRSSGVTRYLIISQAIACVLAGAGWVTAVHAIGDRRPTWRVASRVGAPLLVAALAVPSLITLERWFDDGIRDVRYQEGAYEATAAAVKQAGGADVLNRCGQYAWSADFREPELAWLLHKHLAYVRFVYTPDLSPQARVGPMVQIAVRGGGLRLPKPFSSLRYREIGRANAHGVAAAVLDPC